MIRPMITSTIERLFRTVKEEEIWPNEVAAAFRPSLPLKNVLLLT